MKPYSLNTLRTKFIEFFEGKGHTALASYPLLPQADSSLLLINAGMAPLKKFFTGEDTPPSKRVATCQKCVRTNDIENVGYTSRHGTFFEMLGNFSFGDYFKEEAIPWAWEFLTKVLEIPEDKLYPSVYIEDDEAAGIWVKTGVPAERITRLGKEDNFWEIGAGPCGPCSEIYYDRGEENGCGSDACAPGCECDRFIEVWNIVFTQFESDGKGNYTRLAHPNIDTGMGLERLACVMQGVNNLFEVDTIKNIMLKTCELSGIEYTGGSERNNVSLRIITDHIRTAVFLISDGILPSNEGRGYILRRVLRRAARHGRLLGISGTFLSVLCETVIGESAGAYPELVKKADFIKKTISVEEERFAQTIDAGLGILDKMLSAHALANEEMLSGEEVFKLYDTFGFPLDLTKEITEEKGISIDETGFSMLMAEQRKRARDARKSLGDAGWAADETGFLDDVSESAFVGYEKVQTHCEILLIMKDGEPASEISGGEAVIVLDSTPFYAESGGQVADIGTISTENGIFNVTNVIKTGGHFLHIGALDSGTVSLGTAKASVLETRRQAIMRNHSAIHLLQSALRSVLGDHVEQAGSLVSESTGRFDYSHFSAMTSDEIFRVESLVNEWILAGYDVEAIEMTKEEAIASGATALFSEKYGEKVRVVRMGEASSELCGGTHVNNTSKIGLFKILSETSISAGVRRIECTTGMHIIDMLRGYDALAANIRTFFKATSNDEIMEKIITRNEELKEVRKNLENANISIAVKKIADALGDSEVINGIRLVREKFDGMSMDTLRLASDRLLEKNPDAVCLFASVSGDKVAFSASCGKTALERGAHAGMLLKAISPIVGGGGGGKADNASSGGRDISRLDEAIAEAARVLAEQLRG